MLLAAENRDCLSIGTQMAEKTRAAINLFAFQSAFCEPVFRADYGKLLTVKMGKESVRNKQQTSICVLSVIKRCGLKLDSVPEVCLKCTFD